MIQLKRRATWLPLAFLGTTLALSGCSDAKRASQIPSSAAYTGRKSSTQNILLYAAGNRKSYVVSYPAGTLVGTIDRPSFGACADSSGNVYMTGVGSVAEFPYGQTVPSATASIPGTAYSCSVDPTTGDLAVVVFCSSGCTDEVAVFTNLNYPPQLYQTSALTQMLFCGYDGSGNLFVDGFNKTLFAVAELPFGGTTFSSLSVVQAIKDPGEVQWDGQHITIEDTFDPAIYQYSVDGSVASIVGSTGFRKIGRRAAQSWIGPGIVAVPTGKYGKRAVEIGIWAYPSGGKRLSLIKGFIHSHKQITGIAMSILPSGRAQGF